MFVPAWVWIATAIVFGCSAYLAMQAAEFVYAKDAPLEGGPAPARVPAPVLILGAAILGGATAFHGPDLATLATVDLIAFSLVAAIWTDVTRGFIGDWFTLPPLVLVLVLAFVEHRGIAVAIALLVVTLPFAVAAFASKGLGMGWGDVKLVALGGALLDLETSMLVFAAACMIACGIAFARRKRSQPIAFAPYLAAAIVIGLLMSNAGVRVG